MKKPQVKSERVLEGVKMLASATLTSVRGGTGNGTNGPVTPLPHPNV